jgi:cell wall-associated NlpC family hydrolase
VHGLGSGRHRRGSVGSGKLALKLGLCLCAGQLVAAPVLATAADAAPVTTAAQTVSVKPTVTETTNTRTIYYGSTVRVTARVIDPRTGQAVKSGGVRLQAYRNGAWRTWQTRSINTSGVVTFTSRPLITGSYRSVYIGSTGYSSAVSNAIQVTVRPTAAKVLAEAKRHTGALYLYGAAGPYRFDCSGYTLYVYRKAAGRYLPHKANSQQYYGRAISKADKRVGDLIVFRSGTYGYHAAIYAGGGYMYDSPHSGARVGLHRIFSSSYVVRRLV